MVVKLRSVGEALGERICVYPFLLLSVPSCVPLKSRQWGELMK